MQDLKLYQQILELEEPWHVTGVDLNRQAREIEVTVSCGEQIWGCPQCQRRMHIHSHKERRWRHLDSCQFKTYVKARVPMVECEEHGLQQVQVPWAEKRSRFTALFERLAVDVMLECSISGACDILGISWDEADGIKHRAVRRGLERRKAEKLPRICIDEKSAGRGQDYVTVVARIDPKQKESAQVWHVADGRKHESLEDFWKELTEEQIQSIEAVAMDLWEPYKTSVLAHVPDAKSKIVHDGYHLVKHMNDAVDKVRKKEHKALFGMGNEALKGTKYLWLYGEENLSDHHKARFHLLKSQTLKTARAWSLKEMFRAFWKSPTMEEGTAYFNAWYSWAVRSRLGPVKKVAKMCKSHIDNILTFFTHRISNGPLEGLNNRIQGLVKKAFGYRNRERLKTDILFHLGGLDLYPLVENPN